MGSDPIGRMAVLQSALRKTERRVGAWIKKLLIVLVMLLALLLSPFALPVTIVIRWVNRATGRTEQVVRDQSGTQPSRFRTTSSDRPSADPAHG
jgi:hypothetical protein